MKIHPRFDWATNTMAVKSNDRILEIGCGVGFAVQSIAPSLNSGYITAIDRSPTAISRALERNRTAVQQGKVEFVQIHLLQFIPKHPRLYTKVFCFNINFFWTKKSIAKECEVIRSLLAKNGNLYIFYGPMIGGGWEKTADATCNNLGKEQFKIANCTYDQQLKCLSIIAAL